MLVKDGQGILQLIQTGRMKSETKVIKDIDWEYRLAKKETLNVTDVGRLFRTLRKNK